MGKGRKTRTHSVKEKYEVVNWARNLPTDKLGAVVFGCKNHTITECFDKEIFGLPAAHYSYVKNVTPGLPLFLFNYSDRMLHGIFEAVSSGQMNISRHAWITGEGAESTPYPAQVRVRELRKCHPLPEEEFKPIIAKNYYAERFFWFELDKEQNRRLMKLFLSSPLAEKMPRPPNAAQQNFDVLSCSNLTETAGEEFKNLGLDEYSGVAEILQENEHSLVGNRDAFAPEKKWTELFKPSSSSYPVKNGEVLESKKGRLNPSMSDCFDMEWKFASSSEEWSEPPLEACPDSANTKCDSYVVECWEDNEVACSQYHDRESDRPDLTNMPSSENRTFLDVVVGKSKPPDFDYVLAKEPGESFIVTTEGVSGMALAPLENCERDLDQPNWTDRAFQEVNGATSGGMLMDIQSSDSHYVIVKLLQEIQGLKVSQSEQRQKVECLEHELVHSKLEIDQLKNRCHKLESVPSSAMDHCNIEYSASSNFKTEESVFIVGGFDGTSWLPDLSLYFPSQDHVISLCPMTFSRSYASVAKLNGELYIFGGAHDGVWYDIVESYNPISNAWVQGPSLNRRKGSLAGASMDRKIFAIGGGNGVECFSDVELLDLNSGGWISTQSMLEKRFAPAPAAADMNGALYVAGGYDGRNYLRSVERFDPREHAWASVGGMNLRRGCHSLVAFKEKLYALGGYNGDTMVSTVEVFDPRFGSWTMDKPMTISRGYFGSFVLGGKIYVIGGVQDREILDVIECYTEESGWQVTGTTAFGKRSFFSTLVL